MVLAVVTTLGIRAVPEATAAETVQVGKFLIEVTDGDQIRYTDTTKGIRYDYVVPADSQGATVEEVRTLLNRVSTQVLRDFGWDPANAADLARAKSERNRLYEALHSLGERALATEEMAPLRALRDFLDKLEVTECRDRCLPDGADLAQAHVLALEELFSVVNKTVATVSPSLGVTTKITNLMLAGLLTAIAEICVSVVAMLTDIPALEVRNQVILSLRSLLIVIEEFLKDAEDMSRRSNGTVQLLALAGAQDVADKTPSEEDTGKDYDMVKDEL